MADNNDQSDDGTGQICKVYDKNDFFTILVQLLLACFALASLWIKRLREVPKRTFRTWLLDVSKQGFGACYAHVMNMVIAAIISQNVRGNTVLQDQCAWYGMSYLIDTTLGLVLAIFFLKALDWIAHKNDWISLKHSGVYVGADGWVHWVHQVLAWLFILTLVKFLMYLFMWLASEPLAWLGGILFEPLQGNIHFELVFVMILFPGLLNVIYFWIADSFLKAKKEHSAAHESETPEMEDKKEALLTDEDKTETTAEAKPWATLEQQTPGTPASWV
jgi:hypothetical protein